MSRKNTLTFREIFMTLGGFLIITLFLWLLFFLTNPQEVFLILSGILFIFFLFIKPLYGLLFLIILRPTLDIFTNQAIFSIGEYSLNIASILAVLAISFSVIMILGNFKKLRSIPLKLPLLLFALLTFISIFYSFNSALSMAEWLRILSIFSLYVLGFILIKDPADFKKLLYVIIISVFIPGLVAFYQFLTQTGMTIIDENISNRIFGTFAHPNLFAYYLTIPLAILTFLILNKEKNNSSNSFLYLSSIPIFTLLLLTYTRGAWVVFLIIIFTLGIIKYKKFLLAAILGLVFIYLIAPPLHTRVNNLFEYDPYSSIQWRINLWKDSIKYSQEKLIIGHGLGTASEIILDRRGESFGSPDPHNDYLKILLENGILGIISYLFIILSLILSLLRKYLKSDDTFNKSFFLLLIGISLALYFMSFADNVLRNTALQWTFWILLGAFFSIHHKSLLFDKK